MPNLTSTVYKKFLTGSQFILSILLFFACTSRNVLANQDTLPSYINFQTWSKDSRDIGLSGVKHEYRSLKWHNHKCSMVFIQDTLFNVINGYNNSSTCNTAAMSNLYLDTVDSYWDTGQLVFKGVTNYRYLNTSNSYVTSQISVKFIVRVTDSLNRGIKLYRMGKSNRFIPTQTFFVHQHLMALAPSGARYSSGSAGNWYGNIQLFNNLYTDQNSIICTSLKILRFELDTINIKTSVIDDLICAQDSFTLKNNANKKTYWNIFNSKNNRLDSIYKFGGLTYKISNAIAGDSIKIINIIYSNISTCSDSSINLVYFQKKPDAYPSSNQESACLHGNNFNFNVSGNATNLSYKWTFGNDATPKTANTKSVNSVRYQNAGLKTAKLEITDSNNCSFEAITNLSIYQNPRVSIPYIKDTQCLRGNQFQLKIDTTWILGKQSINWSLGNGSKPSSSTDATPVVSYSSAGSKTIRVIIKDENTCTDTSEMKLVILSHPDISISGSTAAQCLRANKFTFKASATSPNSNPNYSWNFPTDANIQTVNTSNANNIKFSSKGTKSIKAIVADKNGCFDTSIFNITVKGHPQIDSISVNKDEQCLQGNSFQFKAKINWETASSNYYWWNTGNGTPSNVYNANPTGVSFSTAGNKTIKLIVRDSNLCQDTFIYNKIRVLSHPQANFIIDGLGKKTSQKFCFDQHSLKVSSWTKWNTYPKEYNWSMGSDAIKATSTDSSVNGVTYTSLGKKKIKLIVTDNNSCKDTIEKEIEIIGNPTAQIKVSDSSFCINKGTISFSSNAKSSTGSNVNSFAWGFDNGVIVGYSNMYTANNPKVSYQKPGKKRINLQVLQSNGCGYWDTIYINASDYPKLKISVNELSQCINGQSFNFYNWAKYIGDSTKASYYWDLGNTGSTKTSNLKSVNNIKYSTGGSKTVRSIITDANGCKDTQSLTLRIKNIPTVIFDIDSSKNCLRGNSIVLESKTTGVTSNSIASLNWQSVGGDFSPNNSSKKPNIQYTSAGLKTVKLIVVDTNSCRDTLVKHLNILSHPNAIISNTKDSQCYKGNTVNFSQNSKWVIGASGYAWNLGNSASPSSSSNSSISNVSFNSPGTKSIQLIVWDQNGCTDTAKFVFALIKNPIAKIHLNLDSQCLRGNAYYFYSDSSKSSLPIKSYSWNWDYSSSTLFSNKSNSPEINYSSQGNKRVVLSVIDQLGCSDTTETSVFVKGHPKAQISVNNKQQCLNNQSFDFNPIVTWATSLFPRNHQWLLPNESNVNSSTADSLNNVKFNKPGNYNINLKIQDGNGCWDTTKLDSVVVQEIPEARIGVDTILQCLRGNSFHVYSKLNHYQYRWDGPSDVNFSDGYSIDSNWLTFQTTGVKKIRFIAGTIAGCYDTSTVDLMVLNHPRAFITSLNDSQCLRGNQFQLNATASSSVSRLIGSGFEWSYDYKVYPTVDLSSSITASPKYSNTGIKTIRLVVLDSNKCRDTTSYLLKVLEHPTAAIITSSDSGCFKGHFFNLNSSINWINGAASYNWKFTPDANINTSNNASESNLQFNAPGKKSLTLIATDKNTCADTVFKNIQIFPQASLAINSNYDSICLKSNNFNFQENTSISTGRIDRFNWDLGDGNFATGTRATHEYTTAKKFTVRLTTQSDKGCKDTVNRTIVVHPQSDPWFQINTLYQCLKGNSFTYTDSSALSLGQLKFHYWDFGDGTVGNGTQLLKTYKNEGDFNVRLITETDRNCLDTVTRKISIFPEPKAQINIADSLQCFSSNLVAFKNNSTVSSGNLAYTWNFGDNNSSSIQNPQHRFNQHGNFTVRLVAATGNTCSDTVYSKVTIYPNPMVKFGISEVCKNTPILFKDSTTIDIGTIDQWRWDFGDANLSTLKNPNNTYKAAGPYSITLIATSDKGCNDTLNRIWNIRELPLPGFSVKNTCLREINQFTSTSTAGEGTLTSWDWQIDGTTYTGAQVNRQFVNVGTKQIALKVTNNFGCTSTHAETVEIQPHPIADFDINGICIGEAINFNDKSQPSNNITQYYWQIGLKESTNKNELFTFTQSGSKLITHAVRNIWGCWDTLIETMVILPKLALNFDFTPEEPKSAETITLKNLSTGADRYLWDLGDGSQTTEESPAFAYKIYGPIKVTLTGFNADGCSDSISKQFSIKPLPLYWVPNVFSPGESSYQLNDSFGMVTPLKVSKFRMMIFNQWGQLLFETRNVDGRWDGKYMGERVMNGVYNYHIFFYDIDGKAFKLAGQVIVID